MHAGAQEVHIVFDDPGRYGLHPKDIERRRRDSDKTSSCDGKHTTFHYQMKVPSKWNDMLGCRQCKRQLVSYLGGALLQLAPSI